jgi:uncharacterized protein YdaU (DUF1376 family)
MTTLMGFAMHYYQHHIGDFIKDTSFLTNEEVGIYMKMIWIYYDTEEPIPNSLTELSMRVNARGKEDLIKGLLDLFFISSTAGWHHKRCDKEIEHYRQQLEFASKAGKASAAKRALNKTLAGVKQESNDRSTTVQPTNNQQPITNNHIEEQQEKPASKEKKRGTRLSEDWQPDEKLIEFAKAKRPDLNLNDTVRMFKNYWVSKTRDATKLDWNLTFENWVMNQKASYAKPVAQPTASAYGDRASV